MYTRDVGTQHSEHIRKKKNMLETREIQFSETYLLVFKFTRLSIAFIFGFSRRNTYGHVCVSYITALNRRNVGHGVFRTDVGRVFIKTTVRRYKEYIGIDWPGPVRYKG